MKGKCYIYKRAEKNGRIIDYTDGTEPFDCTVFEQDGYPTFQWIVPDPDTDEELEFNIPLNVPRTNTQSIVEKGEFGDIEYEFLFGKFRTRGRYFFENYGLVMLLCILLLVVLYLLYRCK